MEEKTYKGLGLWVILMISVPIGCAYLSIDDSHLLSLLPLNACTIFIAVLTFMIFRTGRVYWYNGITYDQAASAGSQKCKAYALKHFRDFGLFALCFLMYSAVSWLLHFSFWIDISFFCICLITIGIHSMKYRL